MKLSQEGAMELIGHEGIVLTRYLDSVGVWTIGVGHTRASGAPDPETFLAELSLAKVLELFERDVQKYVKTVNAALKRPVTQAQFDALVSFHFNTGAIGRASLVNKLNAGDIEGAATGFMAWNKPPEIIERRTKEATLFRTGRYSNNGMATIFPADGAGKVQWHKPKRVDLRKSLASGAVPPPPDVPAPKPKPAPAAKPSTGSNAGGAAAGAVVLGGGTIIATQQANKGASASDIAMVVGLILVIAVAVGFTVQHLFKRN